MCAYIGGCGLGAFRWREGREVQCLCPAFLWEVSLLLCKSGWVVEVGSYMIMRDDRCTGKSCRGLIQWCVRGGRDVCQIERVSASDSREPGPVWMRDKGARGGRLGCVKG